MQSKGNPGMNLLGGVLSQRMHNEAAKPLTLDFGEIGGDYSLTTNTFPEPIPQTDYLVNRHLTLEDPLTETYPETCCEEHKHDVVRPEKLEELKPGDRVLVAWVQNDAVVICVIVPATEIGG